MKTEIIEDFSGGINNTLSPNRVAKNELATSSNCWYDVNAIKARGAFKTGVASGSALITFGSKTYAPDISQGSKVIVIGSTSYVINVAYLTSASNAIIPIVIQNPDSVTDDWLAVTYGVGTVATTNGSAVITGSGTTWTGSVRANDLFTINTSGQTQVGLVSTVDSDTQITLTANWTTTNAAGTAYRISPSFTSLLVPSFDVINSKVYMTARNRMPGYWNATSFFNNTNSPICQFYKVHKNYMFAANTAANPSRVSWSAIKDAETWPASNFIDVSPDDGQLIVGLFSDGQSLLIIKKRSIYRLTGDIFDPSNPTYVLTKVYTPPECAFDSDRTFAIFNGTLIFYGGTGFYQYDGNVVTRFPVSDNLLGTLNAAAWIPANFNAYEAVGSGQQAITYNGDYWITSTQGSTYGNILMLDRNLKWWIFSPPDTTGRTYDFFIKESASTTTYNSLWTLIRNSSGVTVTYLLDQSFSNETINASFTTRVFQYAKKQRFGLAYLHFKRASTGTISFGYKVDEGTTVTVTIDMTTGSGNRAKSPPIMIGRVGQAIQFVISHNASAEDFEVYAIEFERQDFVV